MSVIERINGFRVTLGGESHSGWLPPGAADPLPTPVRNIQIDMTIEADDGGYLLVCTSRDNTLRGDTWHESLFDAREQARASFGVPLDGWTSV